MDASPAVGGTRAGRAMLEDETVALRRLASRTPRDVSVARPSVAVPLATATPGSLSWLPYAERLAAALDPAFLIRLCHLLEVEARWPRATRILLRLAAYAHAALVSDARPMVRVINGGYENKNCKNCSPLSLLSGDLLVELARRAQCDLALALTCRALRDAVHIAIARTRLRTAHQCADPSSTSPEARGVILRSAGGVTIRTSYESVVAGSRAYLRWAVYEAGYPKHAVCRVAAREGRLDTLQWARDHGLPWTIACEEAAAGAGRVEVLRWASERGELSLRTSALTEAMARTHARSLFRSLNVSEISDEVLAAAMEQLQAEAQQQMALQELELEQLLMHEQEELQEVEHALIQGHETLDANAPGLTAEDLLATAEAVAQAAAGNLPPAPAFNGGGIVSSGNGSAMEWVDW